MTSVISFEATPTGPRELGRYASMTAASATLPTGAYTTFRSYSGNRVLRLAQHFRRLEESAALMGQIGRLQDDPTRAALAQILHTVRGENWPTSEARFRLTFAPPQLFIAIEPFQPYPQALYESGVRCVSVSLHRDNPHAKSTRFIASAAEAYKSLPDGVHEGLMVGADGAILEGLSSNFFAIPLAHDNHPATLHTEEQRVLIGVTRTLVLEVAQRILPVSRTAATMYDLAQRQIGECFITSVSREIMPVVQIDAAQIGASTPGPITRQLMQGMATLIHDEAEPLYVV